MRQKIAVIENSLFWQEKKNLDSAQNRHTPGRFERGRGRKRPRGRSSGPSTDNAGTPGRTPDTIQDGGPRSSQDTPGGFQPFDYSSVNFRDFQSRTPRSMQLNSGNKKVNIITNY